MNWNWIEQLYSMVLLCLGRRRCGVRGILGTRSLFVFWEGKSFYARENQGGWVCISFPVIGSKLNMSIDCR